MTPISLKSTASGQQELNRSNQVLFSGQRREKKVEIFWEKTSGFIQGRVYKLKEWLPIAICGMPKRRAEEGELFKVKQFFDTTTVKIQEDWIEVQPKLLGRMNPENKKKLSLFISYDREDDSSKNAVNHLKKEIKEQFDSADTRYSLVFKEEPKGTSEWQKFIRKKTKKADLILLYITKKYLKSNFCLGQIFEAMKVLGNEWAKKMRIICDSEMQELLKTSEAWFQYLNECADFWEKEDETIEKGFKDATVGVQMALASEREYLYRNRADIPSFIQGIRIRNRSTVEDLKRDIVGLMNVKRVTSKKTAFHTPEIYEYISLIPTFTGREKLLVQMEEKLRLTEEEKDIHKTKVVVLSGLGGVGKTQLAAKFIEGHLKHYNLVWTFDAKTDVMLQESYRELAQELKLIREDEKAVPSEEILARVNRWLKAPSNHGWLLYFDNVDSLEIVQPKSLPQHGGQILITSRQKTHWENFYPVIEVQEFEREESNNLLIKIIPEGKQEGQVNALAEKLGDFPLALDQAGSFIKNNVIGLTITDYLDYFQGNHREIWEAEQEEATNKLYPATVAMTWKITMDYIKKKFPNAAKALNLCAYLNSTEIPLKWLIDWWKEKTPTKGFQLHKELNDLVKPLVDFSLLRQQEAQKMLSVHQLVQLVTQDNLSEDEKEEFIREGLRLINGRFDAYDHDDPKTWEKGRKYMPHAISVTNHAKKGKYLLKNTDLKEILSPILNLTDEIALSLSNVIFYASDQGGAASLFHQMATYVLRQGNAFKAKKYYTQALEMTKAFLGESHPSVASTLNNLGTAWSSLGEKKKAIEYYEKALEMTKAFLGESHPSVASTLNNLGTAWSSLGEKKKAIEYYEKALEMTKAFLGESHPNVASTLHNLGTAWSDLGEKKKAIEYYEKALEMKKAFFGESHPNVASTLHNLGAAWSNLGAKKKAIEYYEKALEILKAFLGENHPSVAKTLNNLACRYSALGQDQKAIEFLKQAKHIYKTHHDKNHFDYINKPDSLAEIYNNAKEYSKSLLIAEKALKICKEVYKDGHWIISSLLIQMGRAHYKQKQFQQAQEYQYKALTLAEKLTPNTNTYLSIQKGNALLALGKTQRAQHNPKVSLDSLKQAHEAFRNTFSENHPNIAKCHHALGQTYQALHQQKEAHEHYQQAYETALHFFSKDHPDVLKYQQTLTALGLSPPQIEQISQIKQT